MSRQAFDQPVGLAFVGSASAMPLEDGSLNVGTMQTTLVQSRQGFGANPAYLISNSAEESYAEGKDALTRLLEEFKGMQVVQDTLRESGDLVNDESFAAENKLAPPPDCTDTYGNPQPTSLRTICWQFADGLS